MSRRIKIGVIALLGSLALWFVWAFVSPDRPSKLFVRVDAIPWQSVTVESDNLPSPVFFENGDVEIVISPVVHGVYRVGIQLSDGRSIWCEFLHTDVGVRRRVDLIITSSPAGFHFRESANGSEVLFEGETSSDNATRQKPFRLDWI
jgi:hypothetical protein